MTTARATLGSILGAVSISADSIGKTIASIGDGADMLNSYVREQRDRQHKRIAIDAVDYLDDLIEDRSQRRAERAEKLHDWLSAKPAREAAYQQAHARYAQLFTTEEAA